MKCWTTVQYSFRYHEKIKNNNVVIYFFFTIPKGCSTQGQLPWTSWLTLDHVNKGTSNGIISASIRFPSQGHSCLYKFILLNIFGKVTVISSNWYYTLTCISMIVVHAAHRLFTMRTCSPKRHFTLSGQNTTLHTSRPSKENVKRGKLQLKSLHFSMAIRNPVKPPRSIQCTAAVPQKPLGASSTSQINIKRAN